MRSYLLVMLLIIPAAGLFLALLPAAHADEVTDRLNNAERRLDNAERAAREAAELSEELENEIRTARNEATEVNRQAQEIAEPERAINDVIGAVLGTAATVAGLGGAGLGIRRLVRGVKPSTAFGGPRPVDPPAADQVDYTPAQQSHPRSSGTMPSFRDK